MRQTWLIPFLLMIVALLIGLWKARNLWDEINEDEDPATASERLRELEAAHAEGEIDTEELQRIRQLLNLADRPAVVMRSQPDIPRPDRVADRTDGSDMPEDTSQPADSEHRP